MEYHMEEHLRKIKCKKMFFLKSFVISIIILLISYIIELFMYDSAIMMVERMYGLEADDYAKIFVMLFGLWKILIIQFTLVPFIVMAMIEGHIKKYHMKHE